MFIFSAFSALIHFTWLNPPLMTAAWPYAMNPPMFVDFNSPHSSKKPQTKQKTVKNIGNLARKTLFNFLGREPGKEERKQNQNKLQDSEVH